MQQMATYPDTRAERSRLASPRSSGGSTPGAFVEAGSQSWLGQTG